MMLRVYFIGYICGCRVGALTGKYSNRDTHDRSIGAQEREIIIFIIYKLLINLLLLLFTNYLKSP